MKATPDIDRRTFIQLAALAGLCHAAGGEPGRTAQGLADTPPSKSPRKPNIVFILIDDLGYADLACYGSEFHETPHLDQLAASGVRFTQAYAAAPVCSPTRASIMTGRYPARLHLTNFLKGTLSPPDSPVLTAPYLDALPLEEVTIAELLRDAGYTTCHIGKWHLGNQGFWPEQQGFDVNVAGCASGMPRSFYWPEWKGNPPIEGAEKGEYLTDRLTSEACKFIEAHREQPFFLYLSHYAVHIPLEAKEEKVARYEAKLASRAPDAYRHKNPYYAAMLESVDEGVGRVLDTLLQCGLTNDTLVVFFSDNGGLSVVEGPRTPATDNFPFRAGKGYLYEGGIREPMIVSWPGHTPQGVTCATPVISTDFLPTFCALAGVPEAQIPAVDGLDVSSLFNKPGTSLNRESLFWHYPHFANQGGRPAGAVRHGNWKLIEHYEDQRVELFDLDRDPGETADLAGQQPEVANHLRELLHDWREQVSATMPPENPDKAKETNE